MSTAVFPVSSAAPGVWGWPGIAWEIRKAPEFNTAVATSPGGREQRLTQWVYPRWHLHFAWNVLRDQRSKPMYDGTGSPLPTAPYDELRRVVGFFLQQRGRFLPFFFDDPTDNVVVDQTIITSAPASTVAYQVPRSYAGVFVEPVGGVNAITNFKINTVAQSGGYVSGIQLNTPVDGWITLPSAPPPGALLQATFSYYFRMRFMQDTIEVDNFMDDLWSGREIELISVKA